MMNELLVILWRNFLDLFVKHNLRSFVLWYLGFKGGFESLDLFSFFGETGGINFVAVEFKRRDIFELFRRSHSRATRQSTAQSHLLIILRILCWNGFFNYYISFRLFKFLSIQSFILFFKTINCNLCNSISSLYDGCLNKIISVFK